jgi:drug/metabolite transporter (DMT)-like permease
MDWFVFAAVLFGAACHAAWNAAIKIGIDTVSVTALIALGAGIVALVLLAFVGLPLAAAVPWLFASMLAHIVYFGALSEGYRIGDLGQIYPLARGTAPVMTAALSSPLVGEQLGLFGWSGIIALAAGVILLSTRGGRELARFESRAVALALFTAVTICAYSFIDGIGARLAGSPHRYTACLFVGNGVLLTAYGAARGRRIPAMLRHWKVCLAGGALQLLSYGIAIWAMTVAPIAIVAALRETSVLFGSAFAVFLLKEPLLPARVIAALLIVGGLALIRLH